MNSTDGQRRTTQFWPWFQVKVLKKIKLFPVCSAAALLARRDRENTLEATQGQICQSLIDATRSVNLPQMPPDSGGICMGVV